MDGWWLDVHGGWLGWIFSPGTILMNTCLEDHPMTCKWLITMVIVGPLSRVMGPLPHGLSMAYKWG